MDEKFLVFALPLLAGYLLDLFFGDPRWLPHPIRLFGTLITKGELFLNKPSFQFLKGLLLSLFLCLSVFFFFYLSGHFILHLNVAAYIIYTSIFVFYGLANKSLLQEGKEVFDVLLKEGLDAGRKRLSWIVGRDTQNLDANQIRIAVFETLSENLCDGVVAPLFYYAIGGLPAMMTYKMVNTLDSMIGYKNERYFQFGKFAARLDDVANFIPARMTAFLMVLVKLNKRGLIYLFKFGNKHASINSGYPEAALAGILNCRFGGPNFYKGQLVTKPYIGDHLRDIGHEEFSKVRFINHAVTLVVVACILCIGWIL